MFRLCAWRRPRRPSSRHIQTREELERTTDICFVDSDMEDNVALQSNEACMIEGDKFVGNTANFTDEWEIVPLRPDLHSKQCNPQFEARKESLVSIAKSTCFIGVNPGPNGKGPISGTAFFVSPTILLTAGHMAQNANTRIVAQHPGTRKARMLVEQLFESMPEFETFDCEFVETGWPAPDISVLRVKGDYRANDYIQIEPKLVSQGNAIDVVGYPGCYTERYVQKMYTGAVDREAINAVTELFPKCELIVSHGTVEVNGNMPTYYLSTVIGMSGSPVVMSGKVIGVHRGHSGIPGSVTNQCVAFSWKEVWALLMRHGVVADYARPMSLNEEPRKRWAISKWQKDESADAEDEEAEISEVLTGSGTQARHDDTRMVQSVGSINPY